MPEPTLAAPTFTAADRYESLSTYRSPFLDRAREAARVTIPALMPPSEKTRGMMQLHTPFQSVGARGINNLANKLLLALFPPNGSFFRLTLDEFLTGEIEEAARMSGEEDPLGAFEAALSKVERQIGRHMEVSGSRAVLHEGVRQLLVAGNFLLFIDPDGKMHCYRLHEYVVKRDMEGEPQEIILQQTLSRATMPEEVRAIVGDDPSEHPNDQSAEDTIDVYTRIYRDRNLFGKSLWRVYQEVEGEVVPGSMGTYPLDRCPWVPLRFSRIDGEDYGRGAAEEYLGDLLTVEALSQAITEIAGIASQVRYFVNPGGETSRTEVAEAPNGEFLEGNAKDITVLMLDKLHDFAVAKEVLEKAEKRIEQAFLLTQVRNAERVTAEEIRLLANELEQGLGGVYSLLAQELQLPIVRVLTHQLTRARKLPRLPEGTVEPKIVTGVEALGRTSDLMKLDLLVQNAAEVFGPQYLAEYINAGAYIRRRAAALSIDIEGVLRTEEEVQARRQEMAEQQLTERLGPEAIRQMGQAATQEA